MKNLKSLTLVRHLSREKSTLRKTALWQLHKGTSLIFWTSCRIELTHAFIIETKIVNV